MNKIIALITCTAFAVVLFLASNIHANDEQGHGNDITTDTAIFAGGCFWCIESDFEKLDGVTDVVSGYTGGTAETADYNTVSSIETGHFEAVRVHYDSNKISYRELVEYFWRHIDPTDSKGQFCDKGSSYKSAIFYASPEQRADIASSLSELENSKPFSEPIVTTITQEKPFYLAEEYHQDYYKKSPLKYRFYRSGCRRDARIKELWDSK